MHADENLFGIGLCLFNIPKATGGQKVDTKFHFALIAKILDGINALKKRSVYHLRELRVCTYDLKKYDRRSSNTWTERPVSKTGFSSVPSSGMGFPFVSNAGAEAGISKIAARGGDIIVRRASGK